MNQLIALLYRTALGAGFAEAGLYCRGKVELPGHFRATKKWDFLALREGKLTAMAELKGIGTSFGNNLNNRAEEAVGSGHDIRRAVRSGRILTTNRFWRGYLLLIADVTNSRTPVRVAEPFFKVDSAFRGRSYVERGVELCRRLVDDDLYDSAALIAARPEGRGEYVEPDPRLGMLPFLGSLRAACAEE